MSCKPQKLKPHNTSNQNTPYPLVSSFNFINLFDTSKKTHVHQISRKNFCFLWIINLTVFDSYCMTISSLFSFWCTTFNKNDEQIFAWKLCKDAYRRLIMLSDVNRLTVWWVDICIGEKFKILCVKWVMWELFTIHEIGVGSSQAIFIWSWNNS